jgi:hypothetical protein
MSGLAKSVLAVILLVVTNLGTYAYVSWRCRQEGEGAQRLLAEAQQKQQAAEAQNAALQQRLDRLQVWGHLLELQRDVNNVHAVINQLNFGNAIQAIDRIETSLGQGGYGDLFKQRRPELAPLLEQAKQALRRTDPTARSYLVEFDQRAFSILAGNAMPGDLLPGLAAAPTPAPSPAVSPAATAPAPPDTGSPSLSVSTPTPTPAPV